MRRIGFLALLWAVTGLVSMPVLAFDLQAHRGCRGLLPENTLAGFEHALRLGVTTLELDIAITADGVPVISHDPALNPAITRDAKGQWLTERGPLIRSLSLAQVQSYDVGRINPSSRYARDFPNQEPRDGQRIPTLASLFQLVKELGADQVRFDIETKVNPHAPEATLPPEDFVRVLLGAIREAGMVNRVMVQSFDWRTLEILHRVEPAIRTTYLSMASDNFHTLRDGSWNAGHRLADHGGSVPRLVRAAAGDHGGSIWAPFHGNLTPETLKEAQALKLVVIPWTVNQPEVMQRLIDWGVDGIITDYPDRLREVMARRGMALPAPVEPRR